MDDIKNTKSIKTFKVLRWASVITFFILVLSITLQVNRNILLVSMFIYVVSFVYIVFWRCPKCGKRYSSKPGFISICWPYVSKCLHCKEPLDR